MAREKPIRSEPSNPRENTELRDTLAKLREEIRGHERRYFVLDDPAISDAEFDATMNELKAIEAAIRIWLPPILPPSALAAPAKRV